MMKIEIAIPGRMNQTGSSLLRLIQNNQTPKLDLLVRESIQNSLDAAKSGVDSVNVEYLVNEFNSLDLSCQLEGIQQSLNDKFKSNNYKYLAIRDSNTEGLTGPLHFDEVKNHEYGNLIKLVYDICKPQEKQGSGGSWGIGKTVYFRIGIGLVFYYSRIIKSNGEYESRLAATLVEDEKSANPIIPRYKNKIPRGIAWWGAERLENSTIPVRDNDEINSILNIFSIPPYKNNETGTTIIIPYINDYLLLSDNKPEYQNNETPYWYETVEEYIKIAALRWYSTRIDNTNFPNGPYLDVSINKEKIKIREREPVFQLIQGLYNRALNLNSQNDIFEENNITPYITIIKLTKSLLIPDAGFLAFLKVNRQFLEMTPPNNYYSPYYYFNKDNSDLGTNYPIITYTRKLGMLISYETTSNWTQKIENTDEDEFLIGLFILNSTNTLTDLKQNITLEDYVRASEKADHFTWEDSPINTQTLTIIKRIKQNVSKKIASQYTVKDDKYEEQKQYVISDKFIDALLPKHNFGKGPTKPQKRKHTPSLFTQHKPKKINIINSEIVYEKRFMSIPIQITINKPCKTTSLYIEISTEKDSISIDEWEKNMKLSMPFIINNASLKFYRIHDKLIENCLEIDLNENTKQINYEQILCNLESSENKTPFKISFYTNELVSFSLNIDLTLEVFSNKVKPKFILK